MEDDDDLPQEMIAAVQDLCFLARRLGVKERDLIDAIREWWWLLRDVDPEGRQ